MPNIKTERTIKFFPIKSLVQHACFNQVKQLLIDTWGSSGVNHLALRAKADHHLNVIVAFDGDIVMGIIAVESSNIGPSLIEGTFLTVAENYQNQGVGKSLKIAQIQWAHNHRSTLIFGTAIPEYFEKMGLGLTRIPYHENKWLFIVPYTEMVDELPIS